jgi:hypothetical protein
MSELWEGDFLYQAPSEYVFFISNIEYPVLYIPPAAVKRHAAFLNHCSGSYCLQMSVTHLQKGGKL